MRLEENAVKEFMLFAFDKIAKPFEDGRDDSLGARGFYTLYMLGTYAPKTMTELGELCKMKKQQTTKVIDTLTELGFAQRIYNRSDRRIIQIVITEKGREYLNKQIKSGAESLMKQLDNMDAESRSRFFEAVSVMNPVLKKLR